MSKSYCLSLDDETAAWLDNHVRGTGGTVTAIWRDHIAQLRAIYTAEILAAFSPPSSLPDSPAAALKGAAPGAPPRRAKAPAAVTAGESGTATDGVRAGAVAASSFPGEAN